MRVALVHDYIKEFGGAERVLKVLTEMYPDAPIYTAFRVKGSSADKEFRGREIKESWLSPILKIWKLYRPLRFLIPIVWRSFNFSKYDLVITSCSWYVTRGFRVGPKTKVIAYCHTPPRWLYGYEMSVGFTKYWPVKVYSKIVGSFIRKYDYKSAQKIDNWIANSKNVAKRIEKFYKKDSTVIYPPVDVEKIINSTKGLKKENYFLMVSRLVGAKGLEEAALAAKELGFQLKIVGESHGFSDVEKRLKRIAGEDIELLGRVEDKELYKLYAKAKGLIALARQEDFGMTPVEAMAAGTAVIAFDGGGFKESINGKTGLLVKDTDRETLKKAILLFNKKKWDKTVLQTQAKKFSKEKFRKKMENFLEEIK